MPKSKKPTKSGKAVSCLMYVNSEQPLTVQAIEHAILAVIGSPGGDAVKIAAITALSKCADSSVSISGCQLTGKV